MDFVLKYRETERGLMLFQGKIDRILESERDTGKMYIMLIAFNYSGFMD